jgi:hypothetical protein
MIRRGQIDGLWNSGMFKDGAVAVSRSTACTTTAGRFRSSGSRLCAGAAVSSPESASLVREDQPLAPAPARPDHHRGARRLRAARASPGWGELLVVAVLVVPLVFLPVRLLGGSRPR